MIVSELIKRLNEFPQDLDVVHVTEMGEMDIESVDLVDEVRKCRIMRMQKMRCNWVRIE